MNKIIIREMTENDYSQIYAMWLITSRRALCEEDEEENIKRYLRRNAGLSQVATVDGKIIGTVLAGHDGRQGFIHHMAVLPEYRRMGIAHALAQTALSRLKNEGIRDTHIFCYCDNDIGHAFWSDFGFKKRNDIDVFSYTEE